MKKDKILTIESSFLIHIADKWITVKEAEQYLKDVQKAIRDNEDKDTFTFNNQEVDKQYMIYICMYIEDRLKFHYNKYG